MKISRNLLRAIIVILGVLIGLPVWGLSGFVLWGIACGVTTMIVLDIILLRNYPKNMKLFCLGLYTLTMLCVVIWLLKM